MARRGLAPPKPFRSITQAFLVVRADRNDVEAATFRLKFVLSSFPAA